MGFEGRPCQKIWCVKGGGGVTKKNAFKFGSDSICNNANISASVQNNAFNRHELSVCVLQNAANCITASLDFQKFPGEDTPGIPNRKLPLVLVNKDIYSCDTAAKCLRMRSLRPFPVSSLCCSFSFGVLSNCPGTEFAGMALKSSKTRKIHPRVFPFSKKKLKTGHFTLLFCRGRKRNVPECVTHVQSHSFAH